MPGAWVFGYGISSRRRQPQFSAVNGLTELNPNWHSFHSPNRDSLLWDSSDSDSHSIPSPKAQEIPIHNVRMKLNISRHKMHTNGALARDTKETFGSQSYYREGEFGVRSLHPTNFGCAMVYSKAIHSPCLQLDGLRYERSIKTRGLEQVGVLKEKLSPYSPVCAVSLADSLGPYSPVCAVPLPESLLLEPGYIHRRNERERDRVRSLNEGYDRLKQRLPLKNKDKRISKVDTLRIAIRYIRQLRSILGQEDTLETRRTGSTHKLTLHNAEGIPEHDSLDMTVSLTAIDGDSSGSSDREEFDDDDAALEREL
ncbi:hypothetical protein EGW08_003858 [Elysia chlorotica]|uniref:BHLH domain-containing protein n=1 Tax=Elysia chlorotica TaxID=188477 RepID=A0A3S1ACK4_ELYCH|nr:hypothetical protein EGW08_003858 [Elysia chlorotica]